MNCFAEAQSVGASPPSGVRDDPIRRGQTVRKAGRRVVGRPAGPVRAPLIDLTADQEATLAGLVARAMSTVKTPGRAAIQTQEEA